MNQQSRRVQNSRNALIAFAVVSAIAQAQAGQGSTGAPAPVQDAPAPSATDGLDEITVTAQRKEQSLVDVPISMTVLGEDDLEVRRVSEVQDFIFTIPNITYDSASPFMTGITIRGIGSNLGGRFEPTRVTVDDASFGSTGNDAMLGTRLLDAERIEVLRGPQGTLTGASAMGGIINVITQKPNTEEFSFVGTADLGRFNTHLFKGAANTPVSDKLAFRTVAYVESSDGAVKNIGPSGGNSGFDNYGARLAMRYQPTDRLTLDVAFSQEEIRQGLNNSLQLDSFGPFAISREQSIADLAAAGADYFTTDFITDVGNDGGNSHTDLPLRFNLTTQISSLQGSYKLGDAHVATLLYTHYVADQVVMRDRDKSELALFKQDWWISQQADSSELRIASRYPGALNWVAGVSYSKEDYADVEQDFNGDGAIGGTYQWADNYQQLRQLESTDVFGNVFWDFGDRWHLSAGARYSRTKSLNMIAYEFQDPENRYPTSPATTQDLEEFNPRVALNFDLTDSASLYVQYATGFRAGYANDPRAVGVHDVFPIGPVDVPAEVVAEKSTNYEVGVKGRVLDNRVSFSAALFQMDYEDLQVNGGYFAVPEGYVYIDLNSGEAYPRGFELEAAFRPISNLELAAGVGYVETQLEEFLDQQIEGDAPVSDIRPWTGSASGTYSWTMKGDAKGFLRAEYNYQAQPSQRFGTPPGVPRLPGFEVVNLSVGIERNRWSYVAYFDNVLDEIYWLGDTGGPSRRGAEAYFIPRTFGLRVNVKLGGDEP